MGPDQLYTFFDSRVHSPFTKQCYLGFCSTEVVGPIKIPETGEESDNLYMLKMRVNFEQCTVYIKNNEVLKYKLLAPRFTARTNAEDDKLSIELYQVVDQKSLMDDKV
jgi:hypothetical protein